MFDLTTAVAVGLVACVLIQLGPWIVVHGLAMAVALIWRRARPVVVFGVVAALAAVQLLLPGDAYVLVPHDIAVLIAMYSVVKYADRPVYGIEAGVVCLGGLALVPLKLTRGNLYLLAVLTLTVVIVWLLAWSMRTRRLYVDPELMTAFRAPAPPSPSGKRERAQGVFARSVTGGWVCW